MVVGITGLQSSELTKESLSLDDIETAVSSLKATTQSLVYAHYEEWTLIPQNRVDPRNDICRLWDALEGRETEEHRVTELKTLLDVLLNVCKIHGALQGLDGMMELGETVGASAAMVEINTLLNGLQDAVKAGLFPKELSKLLEDQAVVEKARQTSLLIDLIRVGWALTTTQGGMKELVIHHKIRSTSTKQFYDNPVLLEDVFISLRDLGLLESCCFRWSADLMEELVDPILKDPFRWNLTLKKTKFQTSLSLETVPGKSNVGLKLEATLDRLLDLCRFIHTHIFKAPSEEDILPPDHPIRTFGKIFATTLIERIIWDVLYPGIPTDLESLDGFAKEALKYLTFEDQLKEMGFVAHGTPYPLRDTLQQLRPLFFKKRTAELLATARDILLSDDPTTVTVTEATERSILNDKKFALDGIGKKDKDGMETFENPLALETCQITLPTQTLIELVYQTLMNTENSNDPESSAEFYFAARDMIDLFRALVPVFFADSLANSLSRSLLFFNDCMYVTHHILTLGYRFQKALTGVELLGQCATFLDMISLVRDLGDKVLVRQMNEQMETILALFNGAWADEMTTPQSREDAFQKFLYACSQFSKTARPLLSRRMYGECMGLLVSSILIEWTEQVSPQSERPSKELIQEMKYFETLFKKRVQEEWFQWTVGYGPSKEIVKIPIPKFVPEWEAFGSL